MSNFLLLAFIFLCAGVIAVPLASRSGLGSVLGYLIAGIAISPVLALMSVDVIAIQHFAEFGVVMMLFLVGLELEPKLLWAMRGRLVGLGGGQVLLTAAVIAGAVMLIGSTQEISWRTATAIGLILALSSTAIVLQTLNEKSLLRSDGGQASFSVLLSQDVCVIPILALLPLLAIPEFADVAGQGATHEDHGLSLVGGLDAWQKALVTAVAVAAVVLGGTYLTRPVFHYIAMANLRELFTAAALLLVIGIALLMTLVGLSPALGTFLAGVVLANSEYRHELESDIEPFKGLLLGLFFMTVGASVNFDVLIANPLPVLGLTLGLVVLKIAVLVVLALIFRIRPPARWLFALSLAQAGEFGFVLVSLSLANSVLSQSIADLVLLVVALSMLLTPLLFIFYDRVIARLAAEGQEQDADEIDESNHIILAGRGRVGGIIDRLLQSAGYRCTVVDFSSRQLQIARKFGMHGYFGDATRPDLLHSAGIDKARVLIIAIDSKDQIDQLVDYTVRNHPHVHVIARAVDRDHVYKLWALGCRDIIRETYDSSLRMGRSAFEALGVSRPAADQVIEVFHSMDQEAMVEVADVYDVNIPVTENEAYVTRVREFFDERGPLLQERVAEILSADAASKN